MKKKIIGITGGSGSGKSSVLNFLKTLGAHVIDGDCVARRVAEPGQPALAEIRAYFGEGVILPDSSLNRRKLGNIVFADKAALSMLNKITHKYIKDEIKKEIEASLSPLIIIEAAALFKGGLAPICDFTIAVLASAEVRKKRIMERDSLTGEQAQNRIMSQESDEYYISNCDFYVMNDGDFTETAKKIKKIIDDIGDL